MARLRGNQALGQFVPALVAKHLFLQTQALSEHAAPLLHITFDSNFLITLADQVWLHMEMLQEAAHTEKVWRQALYLHHA